MSDVVNVLICLDIIVYDDVNYDDVNTVTVVIVGRNVLQGLYTKRSNSNVAIYVGLFVLLEYKVSVFCS